MTLPQNINNFEYYYTPLHGKWLILLEKSIFPDKCTAGRVFDTLFFIV
jgi:hypothetical protein